MDYKAASSRSTNAQDTIRLSPSSQTNYLRVLMSKQFSENKTVTCPCQEKTSRIAKMDLRSLPSKRPAFLF